MHRSTSPAVRRAAAAVATAGALLLGSGCAVSPAVNQFSTELEYAPSDGVQGFFPLSETTADGPGTRLDVRNLLLIGPQSDGPARLYGVFVNDSLEEVTVSVEGPGGLRADVTVPPRSSVPLGEEQTEDLGSQALPDGAEIVGTLLADPVGSIPGELVPVRMAVEDSLLEIGVPLLNGSLPEYQTLVPESAATTPAPTDGAPPGSTDDTTGVSGDLMPGQEADAEDG
ncbi:hypothetical protein [Pseudokineococcus sp. 1T1Z-3]|uniref:hypothetical protein n=1 Tax=Pseudokineococcus sp. 1T1Z-3 TaxID=3132745 RepID=UPI0030A0481A